MRTLVLLLLPALALAQDAAPPRLAVTGAAVAVRPAAEARVFFRLTGMAEEAKEAKVKYKEKVDKVLAALKGIDVAEGDVATHDPCLLSGQGDANAIAQAAMRGGRGEQTTGLVSISGVMEVKAVGTAEAPVFDRAAAILDAVTEAGADNVSAEARQYYSGGSIEANGPPAPLVIFLVGDVAALREEAFAKAVDAARAEAALLAGKIGVKVGRVLGAEEVDAGYTGSQDALATEVAEAIQLSAEGPWRIESDAVGVRPTVSLAVRVRVEFAIEP